MKGRPTREEISRYLTGAASEEEEQHVLDWIENDPTARLTLEGFTTISYQDLQRRDPDRALDLILAKGRELRLVRQNPVREPGHPVRRPRARPAFSLTLAIAAGLAILISSVLISSRFMSSVETHQEITTERGEQRRVRLPDGTAIQMHAASRLRIPPSYASQSRLVELEGRAFFEVVPGETPFIIEFASAHVQVLGTSFNVDAYPDDQVVSVVVAEGRVSLRGKGQSTKGGTVLEVGQLGRVFLDQAGAAGRVAVSDVDVEGFLAWRDNEMVFVGDRLEHVAREVSRWYEIDVAFDDDMLKDLRLDARFRNQSIGQVLEAISRALDIGFEISGNTVTFTRRFIGDT